MAVPSYPKVWNIGHPRVRDLFNGTIVIQEKVDGSQFSFGIIDGELQFRSKGKQVYPETCPKLFTPAMELAQSLEPKLRPSWIYRGEAFHRPKHNTLAYERMPDRGFVLFDIDKGLEDRIGPEELAVEARRLGIERIPVLYEGRVLDEAKVRAFLDRESFLGGVEVEGVVVKNYNAWDDRDGKMLMGKYVSEKFKEIHQGEWKKTNPSRGDIIEQLIENLATPTRWEKAIQRLEEMGQLQNAPQDIGPLMGLVAEDLKTEAEDYIKDHLYKAFINNILRGAVRGIPQWYKDKLLSGAFEDDELQDHS